MMKTAVLCSMLVVFTASAEILEFDNNFIEYGEIRPGQTISLPYPYQDNRNRVVIESVAPPAYSDPYVIVPSSTEVQSTGLISSAVSCIKTVVDFFLTNVPALIAGTLVALGVCKLTSLCDSQVTLYEAHTELRSLATPERLSRAAKFVREAVKKYSGMQNN